jgi:hypothetical protein
LYVLLHRALKNAGDFLIFRRAKALIDHFRPDVPTRIGRAWIPVESQFSPGELAGCRGIIICGGPGYQNDLHLGLYPRLDHQTQFAPVVLLALGTYLFPGTADQVAGFGFNRRTRQFLGRVGIGGLPLSARDGLTADVLHRNGFQTAVMTGDPAWYDLEAIHQPMKAATEVRSLAFTPPANPLFDRQGARLMRLLTERYPYARKSVVFHRGIQNQFRVLAVALGWQIDDISGSADGFITYDAVDVHVGYRLHAHLYSLSRGIPSYLLAEDSRGIGALGTLGQLGAYAIPAPKRPVSIFATANLAVSHAPNGLRPILGRALAPPLAIDADGPPLNVIKQLEQDVGLGWVRHEAARKRIRETLPTMRDHILALP